MIGKTRDPREGFVIAVFLQELLYQCHCAFDSYNELRDSLFSISTLQNELDAILAEKQFGKKSMKDVLSILTNKDQGKIDHLINESRKRSAENDTFKYMNQFWEKYEPMHRRLQRSIEYLILHAGKLALLLFSIGNAEPNLISETGRRAFRGKVLRAVTDTKSSSTLANRSLRNTYEHYDERLDLILVSVGAYGHRQIGKWYPQPKSQASGFLFDPGTGIIHFFNKTTSQEQFALQPMLNEIDRLMNQAKAFLDSLSDLEKNLGREGTIKHIDDLVNSYQS